MRFVKTKDRDLCSCCNSINSLCVARGIDFEYRSCNNEFFYHECKMCGHIYLKNVPEPEELKIIYPSNYENYSENRNKSFAYKVKSKLDYLSLKKSSIFIDNPLSVLDIGCADGNTLDVCRKVFPSLKKLKGIDISLVAAKGAIGKGYEVDIGSADDYKFGNIQYDLIIMQQVIEHVFDPENLLKKISLALKDKGLLILETPTHECLDRRIFSKRFWGGYHIPRHFNIFSELGITLLAKKYSLEIVSEEYKPQPGHWIWSLHHLLSDKGFPEFIVSFFYMTNPLLLFIFTIIEVLQSPFTKRMSNMRLVYRKSV